MKTKLVFTIIAIAVMVGFEGCAMGTYTISTDSFKQVISGGSRVAGITFVNNAPIPLRVQVGILDFAVPSGSSTKVGYSNRTIFANQSYNLHVGVVVIPPSDKIGKVRGATDSWDYSQWNWNYQYDNWSNVSERVVLMELSDDGKQIVLR